MRETPTPGQEEQFDARNLRLPERRPGEKSIGIEERRKIMEEVAQELPVSPVEKEDIIPEEHQEIHLSPEEAAKMRGKK